MHDRPPDKKHNFHFVGANDGASAVALLLELAPILKKRDNLATIELVFFDGEESLDWDWNEAARALFGSKRYVKRHRDALLLGEESASKRWCCSTWSAASTCTSRRSSTRDPAAQADLVGCRSQRLPEAVLPARRSSRRRPQAFLEVGIPSVDLIDLQGNVTWHTPHDTIENMDPRASARSPTWC